MTTVSRTILCALFLSLGAVTARADDAAPAKNSGEYLARAGDCVACHSAPGGKAFAGGLKMGSPLGAIYSTNITADRETGIGTWSDDDFVLALFGVEDLRERSRFRCRILGLEVELGEPELVSLFQELLDPLPRWMDLEPVPGTRRDERPASRVFQDA